MSAAPNAVSEFQSVGGNDVDLGVGVAVTPDAVSPKTTSAAIATNFRIMNKFWVVLPARTPRQLISVKIPSAIAAINAATLSLAGACPNAQYFANVTATAAIPPLWVTSSKAQP